MVQTLRMSTTWQKVHVTREEFERHTFCDVCKEPIKEKDDDEVEIIARIGNIWPENDSRSVRMIDCCTTCFKNKVRPLLETSLGVSFHEESDYPMGKGELTRKNCS